MTDVSNTDYGKQITLMLDRGDNYLDEARFQLIQAIYDRAMKQRKAVALILLAKVQGLLESYKADLLIESEKTSVLSARIKMNFPQSYTEVDRLAKHYNVKMLVKLEDRLIRASGEGALSILIKLLVEGGGNDGDRESLSFIELLQSQELDVVKTFSGNKTNAGEKRTELKTTRIFRESQEKFNAEKIVRQAIKEGPDNPGPINPHMLAIRSLSTMQSISPEYLKRFLSYIDTVFWLDQVSEDLKPKTKTKTKRA
jgi:hypothetical protein